jgi:hypothetical protein
MRQLKPSTVKDITEGVVYAQPTIRLMAQHLSNISAGVHEVQDNDEPVNKIKSMTEKYSINISSPSLPAIEESTEPRFPTVLLTGSTGHLGCHLLAGVVKDDNIKLVYAFNRPADIDIKERHRVAFQNAGLDVELLESSKINFVQGDLARLDFGVAKELYREVCVPKSLRSGYLRH